MLYGIEQVVYYTAWNTDTNAYHPGDVGNHTLFWNKDGTSSAPSNTPEEVDASGQPGLYKLVLTAVETECLTGRLFGTSATAKVILIFQDIGPVRLPNAAFNDADGLPLTGHLDSRTRPSAEYALEASVQTVLTTGGAGPWQTADLSNVALEATAQLILTTGGTGPWGTADLSGVALEATSQTILTTGGPGPWTTGGGGTAPTPQEIWEYANRALTEKDGFSLSSSGLDAIDTWTVTISRVTTVEGCLANADMRGTDNANTVVPDPAGTASALHSATDNKIDEVLSDLADHNYWSDSEMAQFRYQVGIDGTTEQPSVVTPNLSQFNHTTDLVRANIIQVNGNTDILLAWARNLSTIVATLVTDAQENPTPTEIFTDLTEPDVDHFKNRAVIVYDGNIAKQASLITGYQLINGQGKLTVAGFTRAPQAGDTLIIV